MEVEVLSDKYRVLFNITTDRLEYEEPCKFLRISIIPSDLTDTVYCLFTTVYFGLNFLGFSYVYIIRRLTSYLWGTLLP